MIHTRRLTSFILLTGLILTGAALQPGFAELTPDTALATSTEGQVTFKDIADDWPYLGSESDKIDLVRDALKERIYAAEARRLGVEETDDYKAQVEDARLSAYLEALFVRKEGEIVISDDQLREYYASRKSVYHLDEHIYLRYLSIKIENPTDDASRLVAKTKAVQALGKLLAGEDFNSVVKTFATNPEACLYKIGPVPTQNVSKDWGQKVVELKPGQLSDVIELEDRMLIVKVLQRNPAGYQPFEKVSPAIRSKLKMEQARKGKEQFIAGLIRSVPVKKIDHQAIEDPQTKSGEVVVQSKLMKITKDEYQRWAQVQSPRIRRALMEPLGRETVIRKNLLLKPYVESLGKKERLNDDPVFNETLEKQCRYILAQRYEDYLFTQNPSFLEVSDEDIQKFYNGNPALFRIPRKAEIRDIIIPAQTQPGDTPQARALAFRYAEEKASEVLEELKQGNKTFAMLALEYVSSLQAGEYFVVDEKTQGEMFDSIVFNLEPGQIAQKPLRTEEGYRIVQLGKIIPSMQVPLTQVKGRVETLLQDEKREKLREQLEASYFLKANAKILEEVILQ